jgi:hypothetical protein
MKDRLKQEHNRRLRMILNSELNTRNKITAIGALAVPVLRYSFGIINWRLEEMKQIDRKTRNMLTLYKMHHPKADIDRLYLDFLMGILIFKGLTARRLYKSFGVKGLIFNSRWL